MMKTLEAVMAIMILLLFIITLFSNYTYNDYKENIYVDKISETLILKTQEKEFRDMVYQEKLDAIHNTIYNYLETENIHIKICDFLENNQECRQYGKEISKKSIYSINYYFYDINKTLNILLWS